MLHVGTATEGASQKLEAQALYPAQGAQVDHGSLVAVCMAEQPDNYEREWSAGIYLRWVEEHIQ
jgi:hypothetical protein